jgi:hypothetical protein
MGPIFLMIRAIFPAILGMTQAILLTQRRLLIPAGPAIQVGPGIQVEPGIRVGPGIRVTQEILAEVISLIQAVILAIQAVPVIRVAVAGMIAESRMEMIPRVILVSFEVFQWR